MKTANFAYRNIAIKINKCRTKRYVIEFGILNI